MGYKIAGDELAPGPGVRLLRTPKPEFDESCLGYLLRLTEANGYEQMSWIGNLAGLPFLPNKHAPHIQEDLFDFTLFSRLTGVASDVLRKLAFPLRSRPDRENYFEFASGMLPVHFISAVPAKACPNCLIESPYLRRVWDLVPVTTCVRHSIVLLDRCAGCGEGLFGKRREVCRCRCGHDWRGTPTESVSETELNVSRFFEHAIGLGPTPSPIPPNPLFTCAPPIFLSSLCFVASHWSPNTNQLGRYLARQLSNLEIHQLLHRALTVFDDWPRNFNAFLTEQRGKQSPASARRGGMRHDFPAFKRLAHRKALRDLSLLREGFQDYLQTEWAGGHLHPVFRPANRRGTLPRYVGLVWAVKRVGSKALVEHFVAAGEIRSHVRGGDGSRRVFLLERADVLTVAALRQGRTTLAAAQRTLGLSHPGRVEELVRGGLLHPAPKPYLDLRHQEFLDSEVNAILVAFEKKVPSAAPSEGEIWSFADLMPRIKRLGLNVACLVEAVMVGQLPICGRKDKPGLRGYLFYRSDFRDWILRRRSTSAPGDLVISIEEAIARLGLGHICYYWLVKAGIIRTISQSVAGRRSSGVAETEVVAFRLKYVSASQLAHPLRTRPGTVVKCLKDRQIFPAVEPEDGPGGQKTLFLRTDLTGLDLGTIVATHKEKTRLAGNYRYYRKQRQECYGQAGADPSSVPDKSMRPSLGGTPAGEISDEIWKELGSALPPGSLSAPGKTPGRAKDSRRILNGILYVLRHKLRWGDLPSHLGFGCGAGCRATLHKWRASGLWDQIQPVLVKRLPQAEGVDWGRAANTGKTRRVVVNFWGITLQP